MAPKAKKAVGATTPRRSRKKPASALSSCGLRSGVKNTATVKATRAVASGPSAASKPVPDRSVVESGPVAPGSKLSLINYYHDAKLPPKEDVRSRWRAGVLRSPSSVTENFEDLFPETNGPHERASQDLVPEDSDSDIMGSWSPTDSSGFSD